MLKKLINYYKRQWKLSEKIAKKISILSYDYSDKAIVIRIGRICCISLFICVGVVVESWEKYYKKIRLRNILKCDQMSLAVDINELLNKKANTEFLGDNLEYDADTLDDYLRNIKVVFGNVDLRALKDSSCLNNLVYVMGDLHLGSLQGLEKLEYVGGKIYFQKSEFEELTEFFTFKEKAVS